VQIDWAGETIELGTNCRQEHTAPEINGRG